MSGDFSLVPLNAEEYADKCLPLVPELRTRLAASLPEGAVLWGAELLNPEDEASTHVLAKCAPSREAGTLFALCSPRSLPCRARGDWPPATPCALTTSPPSCLATTPRFLRSRDLDVDKAATMVASTLAWRKAYGTDAIAADNSVPECLLTIARLWVRAHAGVTAASQGAAQPAGSQPGHAARPWDKGKTRRLTRPPTGLLPPSGTGAVRPPGAVVRVRAAGGTSRVGCVLTRGDSGWGSKQSPAPSAAQLVPRRSLPRPRGTDAAFHHGKVGDGPLIRSRVKLLEAVRCPDRVLLLLLSCPSPPHWLPCTLGAGDRQL